MPPLRRDLGPREAVALGVGGTVGGGVYVLVGAAAGAAGPAALLAFGVAFIAALAIALPYAELACRHPRAGGGYAFGRAVLGNRAGFLLGWAYWGAYLFVSGYVTLGFGGYLEDVTGIPVVIGALGLIASCTALNLRGVRISGRAQGAIVLMAILGLGAFVLWGLPSVVAERFEPFFPQGYDGVLLASLLAFLAFGGFDMVAAAGEEIAEPERNLPRVMLFTLGAVLVLYLLVCLVALGVEPASTLGDSAAPLATAAEGFGGRGARELVVGTALLTTAATANAVLLVTSRIAFAMARDGLLPRPLARVDEGTGAPRAAIGLNALLLAAVAVGGSVEVAAAVGGFLYVLHFVPPLVALVALRRRGGRRPAFVTPLPWLVLPAAFATTGTLLVASGPTGLAGGAAWLALGSVARAVSRRRVTVG